MENAFFYTGIGSRETPKAIQDMMERLARVLALRGWILRSGGADGADSAFEKGTPADRRRIYIPWNKFSDRFHGQEGAILPEKSFSPEICAQAREIASRFHPGWHNLKEPARKLMTRNAFQVLGDDLSTPSKFVWCWAPRAKVKDGKIIDVDGGTGLAVRLAAYHGIPVYHMGHAPHIAAMEKYLLDRDTAPAPVKESTPTRRM